MVFDVSNKIILITGASTGIGSYLSIKLSEERAIIIVNYNNSLEEANKTFREVIKNSPKSIMIKADVSNPEQVEYMYKKVIDTFGYIDVLINNAGICNDSLVQMMEFSQWKQVIETNLDGTFLVSKYFSRNMILNRKGKILNIASYKGQKGCIGQSNYAASKAGIIALTKTMAIELSKYSISVNSVCPGFIITNLNKNNKIKEKKARECSLIDLSYSLDDLLNFIIFYVSDKCKGISGQSFNIDSRI